MLLSVIPIMSNLSHPDFEEERLKCKDFIQNFREDGMGIRKYYDQLVCDVEVCIIVYYVRN